MTPMVLTARFVKKTHPGCKVVFVGPCDAKKLEASRRTVRSDVDFVLTFEEVLGMFAAKGVDKECIPAEEAQTLSQAGSDARKFAVSGGVAQAVVNAIKSIDPTREVKIAKATGLHECRKLLMMAKVGKYDGYLLEGMACPGGCIAVAGRSRSRSPAYFHSTEYSPPARKQTIYTATIHGRFSYSRARLWGHQLASTAPSARSSS